MQLKGAVIPLGQHVRILKATEKWKATLISLILNLKLTTREADSAIEVQILRTFKALLMATLCQEISLGCLFTISLNGATKVYLIQDSTWISDHQNRRKQRNNFIVRDQSFT